ncbi:MAG TPA: F0F1 ATP synthase subunit delta, partial [Aggregatilineales bacterium]|nr:F0F1 ATP synthase subunit delta [Aggregatilineales bacterium]
DFFTALPPEAGALAAPLQVVTAVPLTEAEQQKIRQSLGGQEVSFTSDPSILGGVIVRGQGEQVDASFRTQLTQMREQLV